MNQLLTEMDGFEGNNGVIILAATNRPESLDPALTRPGRFDRRVPVELPDLKGREAILQVHAKKIKVAEDVEIWIRRAAVGTVITTELQKAAKEEKSEAKAEEKVEETKADAAEEAKETAASEASK